MMISSIPSFQRGDVVLVRFPFTDLTTEKVRPAVVVSSSEFNKYSKDLVLIKITSQNSNFENDDELILTEEDIRLSCLQKACKVQVSKIFTLKKDLIIKQCGKLSNGSLNTISRKLAKILQLSN